MELEAIIKSKPIKDIPKRTALNILVSQNILQKKFSETIKPFDISLEQYNVLRILRGQAGKPCNMSLIQERMISKTSNTTRLVDKLLLKDMVTRNVCEINRRKIEVIITKKGLETLAILDDKLEKQEIEFAENLDLDELVKLNYLLEKYRTIKQK
jgi:DNA-binding MarR family transcriptional regulator